MVREGHFMAGVHGNGTPVYKRIQDAIRSHIEDSELKPGDPIASERELARTHGVSLMTARHALAGRNAKAWLSAGAERAHSSLPPKSISTS